MKKTLKYLLVICLLVFTFAVVANAATYSGKCGNNVTWKLNTSTGVLAISGSGAMSNYSPFSSTPWSYYSSYIKTVTIANGVTSIGDSAFFECGNLTSITIPKGITSIGSSAFSWCNNLKSVTLPDGVTSIGSNAFEGCQNMTSIKIGNGLVYIGSYAFSWCRSLTSITLPKGVTEIGNYAFDSCSSLTSITLPDSVTFIGDEAFASCSSLKSITIPKGVTDIGVGMFGGCSSLTSVTIPSGVTGINEAAFSRCTGLKNIIIPNSVAYIGDRAFSWCNNLTTIIIPSGVTYIGAQVFSDCSSLTSVTIPSSVTNIHEYAFFHSTGITIHGCKGSTAEKFAKENGIPFVSIDNLIIITMGSTDALVFGKAVKTDAPPILENDRAMVPSYFVAETLGATSSWDSATRTSTIKGNGVTITITANSKTAYINGKAVALDTAAFIRNDRMYVPMRFIAEALGAKVDWDGRALKSIITKK